MPHESSFAIRTARDFLYKIVVPQYVNFWGDNASSRHALLAGHMYEWAHPKEGFSAKSFLRHYPDSAEIFGLLALARKVSNGTKHFAITAKTSAGTGWSSAWGDAWAPAEHRA